MIIDDRYNSISNVYYIKLISKRKDKKEEEKNKKLHAYGIGLIIKNKPVLMQKTMLRNALHATPLIFLKSFFSLLYY
jgi:hypothetical protein